MESGRKSPIFRDIRRYYCQFCGICGSKKSLFASHLLSNHQEEMKEQELNEEKMGPSLNVCEDCGMEFKKPAHLKQHMLSHSLEVREWKNPHLALSEYLRRLYVAQIATQGKLMLWELSLIDQGQLWRLVTSAYLHANVGHLLINCYSLNSVGPTVETISGSRRFFAIYFSSAVASTAMSYWLCKAPTVGASGAIFGLVGSVAVFAMRQRGEVGRGTEDLQQIAPCHCPKHE